MLETTYLHIGLDKTGSTAIQKVCSQNRSIFSRYGILYPEGGGVWHAQLGSCFFEDPKRYFYNVAIGRNRRSVDDLLNEDLAFLTNLKFQIQQSSAGTLVLSYEGFIDLRGGELEKMRVFLNSVSNVTKVIVYFRDPVSYAISAVSQRAKSGEPLWEELPVRDWRGICETFGKVFGSENLVARKFSKDCLPNGDVRLDFFNQIGLPKQAIAELFLGDDEDNTSLSLEAVLIGDALRVMCASEILSMDSFGSRYAHILQGIEGAKIQLSKEQFDLVRKASKPQIDYLDQTFGIKFEEGKVKDAHKKVASLDEKFVKSIAQRIYELTKATPAAKFSGVDGTAINESIAARPNYAVPQFILHPDRPNKYTSLERGQVVTVNINFLLTREISELEIKLLILDINGRLAFGIGNEQLGKIYSNIAPGSYRASYHVAANLPSGKYTIGFTATEKVADKHTELAWYGTYCELEVHDSISVNAHGYASLHAEMTFSPTREATERNVIVRATGSIALAEALPTFNVGEVKQLGVKIHNKSEICWVGDAYRPVKLSYHWLKQNCEMLVFEGARSDLPADGVRPGQSLLIQMNVAAPNEAGVYKLILTLVQEKVGWLENRGLDVAQFNVEVKAVDE